MSALPDPPTPDQLAAGRKFGSQLSDPIFRGYLAAKGYRSGDSVVIALPGESDREIRERRPAGRHCLIARVAPDAPHGWEVEWWSANEEMP